LTLIRVDTLFNGSIITLDMPDQTLTWDDSYAIALALRGLYPHVRLDDISLGMIYRWTVELPDFSDDPQLANDQILASIYQEWFEEVNPV